MRQETLLFIIDRAQGRVLLAMKKVRFGAGKYNGMGGRVEEGETPEEAAVREMQEEVGVTVKVNDLHKHGSIRFSFEEKPDWTRTVHIFSSETWKGEPVETEEMAPEWFALSDIPFDKMWIDDIHWLPRLIAGEAFDASFHFNSDGSQILKQSVVERS